MNNLLMHVGYLKAGSTFLQTWFQSHPQLAFVPRGIAGFHGTHAICEFAKTMANVRYYVTSDEHLTTAWVEPPSRLDLNSQFAAYSASVKQYQARVCAILGDLFPTARILIVTRGYKSMLRSGFSEYLKSGGTLDYQTFLETFRATIEEGLDPDYLIQLYASTFGESKLRVLPYELLRDDQARFMGLLESWLDLEHCEFNPGRVNPSLTPQELYWYPRISKWVAFGSAKLRGRYGAKLYRLYVSRLLQRERLRPLLPVLALRNKGEITDDDCSSEYLKVFEPRAERLRNDPLYAPYTADYLWNE